jgi:gas vesicle protein
MARKNISKVGYLVGALGIGSLIGILFAPKSGDETRNYLKNRVREGRAYAKTQARILKGRATELVEQSGEAVAAKKNQITTAVNVGREIYRYESDLAQKNRSRLLQPRAGFYET